MLALSASATQGGIQAEAVVDLRMVAERLLVGEEREQGEKAAATRQGRANEAFVVENPTEPPCYMPEKFCSRCLFCIS